MDETAILQAIQAMVGELFERNDLVLTPQTTARDIPGWDSFKQVELIIACEVRFGIKAGSRELDRLRNVGDLVALISQKTTNP